MRSLTGEPTPTGDVAGGPVGEDETLVWEAGGRDGVRDGDGRRQLDEGDVVAAAQRKHRVGVTLGGPETVQR